MLNDNVERRSLPSSTNENEINKNKFTNSIQKEKTEFVKCCNNDQLSSKHHNDVPNKYYFHRNRRIYHQLLCFLLALSFFEKWTIVASHSGSNTTRRTVGRPKITYASQDTQEALLPQPTVKAVCKNKSTEEAGVMSLAYTFSVDWIPEYGTKLIIYNIDSSLVDILSTKLLFCDEGNRKRRYLKLEGKEEVKAVQNKGIIAIDAAPEDKVSQLSEFCDLLLNIKKNFFQIKSLY